jgi:hypothetical protein
MKANKRVQEGDPYSGDSRMSTSICWPSSCLSFSLASSIPDAVFMATVFFYNKLEFLHIDLQKGCSIPRIDATNNLILVNSCSILGGKKKRKLVTEVSLQNETLISYTNYFFCKLRTTSAKIAKELSEIEDNWSWQEETYLKKWSPLLPVCGLWSVPSFCQALLFFSFAGELNLERARASGTKTRRDTHTHTRTNLFGSSHKPEKKEHCKI